VDATLSRSFARRRRAIRVRGRVQGVGFRPAMCRLAETLGLGGFVQNDAGGVWIEIEGGAEAVIQFEGRLRTAAPAVARIDAIEARDLAPGGEADFRIATSPEIGEPAAAQIPPDAAPCADCLRELDDPGDRRHRYPFINCTACGPRFTIVRELPYDRARTTMDAFTLCADCAREYADPHDRRFHAEPNACPACGPRLSFVTGDIEIDGPPALEAAVAVVESGAIVALKGAGGYVLACDATSSAAVAELRRRKDRPHKPLAVMARDLGTILGLADADEAARAALLSPARPIVLLAPRPGSPLAPEVAPGLGEIGFFLPPTPLQHLLLAAGPPLQVMTSGYPADDPIARDDAEARARLGHIADAFLMHDRVIHTRADDSVVRVTAGAARPLRRARGFVPEPVALPLAGPPVLAVGGQLAATVCLTRADEAFLSQHLGHLDDLEAFAFFGESIEKLGELLAVRPAVVAHDWHPDYRSTRWAEACGLPRVAVQHHHAHVAACLAEHRRSGPAIGIAFDGSGHGGDGTLWGGEILEADLGGFRRRGHLRPLALAGGEAAIRAPWRLALAALLDADESPALLGDRPERDAVEALLRGGRCLSATGAGRWFDAIAGLCGLAESSYEGQAPRELEALAAGVDAAPYPFTVEQPEGAPFVIDLRPAVRALCADLRLGRRPAKMAAAFHETMAAAAHAGCVLGRAAGGPSLVALGGGCFANRRLAERTIGLLEADGFTVLLPRLVPPGDGGLAYGQAAVASFRLAHQRRPPCA
jgi:hydrogenase maturation protein HypF